MVYIFVSNKVRDLIVLQKIALKKQKIYIFIYAHESDQAKNSVDIYEDIIL